MNRATIIGYLGADPDIRHTQDGRPVANFRVATSETWRDKHTGEKREQTEWHRIVCFNEGLTKVIEQYVKKGSQVLIEGALQTRKWTDQSGVERYSTEIVMKPFNGTLKLLGGKSGERDDRGGGDRRDYEHRRNDNPSQGSGGGGSGYDAGEPYSDDIPFAASVL